jgi:hypothetical protein
MHFMWNAIFKCKRPWIFNIQQRFPEHIPRLTNSPILPHEFIDLHVHINICFCSGRAAEDLFPSAMLQSTKKKKTLLLLLQKVAIKEDKSLFSSSLR